jgi:hypothetical protein
LRGEIKKPLKKIKKRLKFLFKSSEFKKNKLLGIYLSKQKKMLYLIATIVKDVSVWSMVNVYHGIQYMVYGPVRSEESKQLEELQKMIKKQDQYIQELRDLLKHQQHFEFWRSSQHMGHGIVDSSSFPCPICLILANFMFFYRLTRTRS